jgi:hypothetical protein
VRKRLCGVSVRLLAGCALAALAAVPLLAQDDDAPPPPRAAGRGARPAAPSLPTPHWPDGRVNLGAPPGQTGVWDGGGLLATNPKNYEASLGRQIQRGPIDIKDVPLQDWARALLDYRHSRFIADEPYTRCKPSPGPRSFGAAYGVEIMDRPELQQVFVFLIGGSHTFRVVYTDGRPHPKNLVSTDMGHSIGHWEGDSLVIDSVGFNERVWMSRDALPHTDMLHMVERVTRTDFNDLKYEVMIDDPGAYTAPWSSYYIKKWSPGTELFEYICQENNHGPQLMVGVAGGQVRSSSIVP